MEDKNILENIEIKQNSAVAAFILVPRLIADAVAEMKQQKEHLQNLVKDAEKKDSHAQYELAFCYYKGEYVKQDYKRALYWFRRAAEQKHAVAAYYLGICYENGFGVEKDDKQAAVWYRESAKQGFSIAQCVLGWFLELGKGVEMNKQESMQLYRMSAEQGYAPAQCNLGFFYYHGIAIEEDEAEAVYWFSEAANQKYPRAQFLLGECFDYGYHVEKDTVKAIELYRLAAEQDFAPAQSRLGYLYLRGEGVEQSYTEAFGWLFRGAQKREASAQCLLGKCYEFGYGTEPDLHNAQELYRLSAEQDYAPAQCNLGYLYYRGIGVQENNEEAIRWFSSAAKRGYARAEFLLAECYKYGYGVKKDLNQAVILYQSAADKGFLGAFNILGGCYQYGFGVKPDGIKAIEFYRKGAEQGDMECQYSLGLLFYLSKQKNKQKIGLKWLEKAAKQEHAGAQYLLGECYQFGWGVKPNLQRAMELYTFSGEQGYSPAMCDLGEVYLKGTLCEEDYEFYCTAAEWGSNDAESALKRRFGYVSSLKQENENGEDASAKESLKNNENDAKLLFNNEEYKEYCRQLDCFNWNHDFSFPSSLLNDAGCDLSLALNIFYLADGYSYLLHRFLEEDAPGMQGWLPFMEELYKRITDRKFPNTESLFPGEKHPYKIPLSKVQRFRLHKAGVPEVLLEDIF